MKRVQLSSGSTSLQPLEGGEEVHAVDAQRRRVCAGFTTARAIECLDADGKRTSIRWQAPDVPYTDEDWDTFQTNIRRPREGSPGRSHQDANIIADAWERPQRFAAFAALFLDTEGNLWVSEFALAADGRRRSRFRVFDRDGRLVAFADPFPMGRRAERSVLVESEAVLRVFENTDGAPVVGVFRIRKRN